jgi:uncharacterized protein YjbJ (UPF0337 family)
MSAMNKDTMKGQWDIAKGKLKQKYAQLTDNDLVYIEGQEDELLGRIEKKVGRSRAEIEKFLEKDANWRFRHEAKNVPYHAEVGSEEPDLDR